MGFQPECSYMNRFVYAGFYGRRPLDTVLVQVLDLHEKCWNLKCHFKGT